MICPFHTHKEMSLNLSQTHWRCEGCEYKYNVFSYDGGDNQKRFELVASNGITYGITVGHSDESYLYHPTETIIWCVEENDDVCAVDNALVVLPRMIDLPIYKDDLDKILLLA